MRLSRAKRIDYLGCFKLVEIRQDKMGKRAQGSAAISIMSFEGDISCSISVFSSQRQPYEQGVRVAPCEHS